MSDPEEDLRRIKRALYDNAPPEDADGASIEDVLAEIEGLRNEVEQETKTAAVLTMLVDRISKIGDIICGVIEGDPKIRWDLVEPHVWLLVREAADLNEAAKPFIERLREESDRHEFLKRRFYIIERNLVGLSHAVVSADWGTAASFVGRLNKYGSAWVKDTNASFTMRLTDVVRNMRNAAIAANPEKDLGEYNLIIEEFEKISNKLTTMAKVERGEIPTLSLADAVPGLEWEKTRDIPEE